MSVQVSGGYYVNKTVEYVNKKKGERVSVQRDLNNIAYMPVEGSGFEKWFISLGKIDHFGNTNEGVIGHIMEHVKYDSLYHDFSVESSVHYASCDVSRDYGIEKFLNRWGKIFDSEKFIKVVHFVSTGYSQGDLAEVIGIIDTELLEYFGLPNDEEGIKKAEEYMEGAFSEYEAWLWGDVFIADIDEDVRFIFTRDYEKVAEYWLDDYVDSGDVEEFSRAIRELYL